VLTIETEETVCFRREMGTSAWWDADASEGKVPANFVRERFGEASPGLLRQRAGPPGSKTVRNDSNEEWGPNRRRRAQVDPSVMPPSGPPGLIVTTRIQISFLGKLVNCGKAALLGQSNSVR